MNAAHRRGPSARTLVFALALCMAAAHSTIAGAAEPAGSSAPPARVEMTVELPPLLIEDLPAAPWRYCEIPGLQVLSRCSEGFTRDFVRAEQRLHALLSLVLPREFQAEFSAPKTLLLTSERNTSDPIKRLLAENEKAKSASNPQPPAQGSNTPARTHAADGQTPRLDIRLMPNLRIEDQDTFAVLAIVEERGFNDSTMGLTASHARMLLTRHTPTLPDWLISGVMELVSGMRYRDEMVRLEPLRWISPRETAALQKDAAHPRTLLPTADLFSGNHGGNPQLWQQQAALFIRWALDEEDASMRDRFWNFVGRACESPPDEAAFIACFGFGYADLRDRLSDYLPLAVSSWMILRPATRIAYADAKISFATPEEVARVRGEWERLAISYVRAHHPEFAAAYEQQARATIAKLSLLDRDDAALQAVAGLYYCGEREDTLARPYLERAVAGKVARPRPYFELARIRFSDARFRPEGPGGKLSEAQAASILELLAQARRYSPSTPGTYLLFVETLLQRSVPPTEEQFSVVEQALRLFPRNPQLFLRSATLNAAHGRSDRATELIVQGRALCEDNDLREMFSKLERELTGSASR